MTHYNFRKWSEHCYELTSNGETTLSGSAEEWLAAASAIHAKESISFTRLAFYYQADSWELCCPRNRIDLHDYWWLDKDEGDELATLINKTLLNEGEQCIRGDYDPILLGG